MSDCESDCDSIIARALDENRSQRYQSVSGFYSDVKAILHRLNEPVEAPAQFYPSATIGPRNLLFPS